MSAINEPIVIIGLSATLLLFISFMVVYIKYKPEPSFAWMAFKIITFTVVSAALFWTLVSGRKKNCYCTTDSDSCDSFRKCRDPSDESDKSPCCEIERAKLNLSIATQSAINALEDIPTNVFPSELREKFYLNPNILMNVANQVVNVAVNANLNTFTDGIRKACKSIDWIPF